MKEAVTKFDFESAFKALDEIEIPVAGKVRANRPALTEIFSKKSKFDYLMEEYYDISSPAELEDAKEAREAEVAKAKLERIEKIVDLDAESPEDLLTSYVGKHIMQCPQCMTLFYKDPEDIVKSEEDPSIVNVNEICQHCGNEDGYTLVGKVGEAEPGEFDEPELDVAELDVQEEEATEEEPAEEVPEESEDLGDLEALDLNLEDEEEEKKEESFSAHEGDPLVEELADDPELDDKLEANDEYIEYLRTEIAAEKEKLEKASNEQIKVILQRNIDSLNADLEAAVPVAVIEGTATSEDPAPEEPIGEEEVEAEVEAEVEPEQQEESCEPTAEGDMLTESLHEDADVEVSAEEFEELINSPEFSRPISDAAVRDMLNAEKEEEESVDESLTEASILDVGKAIGKKVGQAVKNKAGKISAALDKFVDSAKTRAEKADWILANALEDYSNADFSNDGTVNANGAAKKFKTFVVLGFADKDKNGKKAVPGSTNLVLSMDVPQEKATYKEAEAIAIGWSQRNGCGPAKVFLAKGATDAGGVYVCAYFNGKLWAGDDQLDKIFEKTVADIAGNKSMQQGGMDQTTTSKVKAEAIKPKMKIKLPNGTEIEVVSVEKEINDFGAEVYNIKANNDKTYSNMSAEYEFNVMKNSIRADESLDTVMAGLEDLQESALESLISDSLVEAYGNVAGFRLAECAYADSKFTIDGTIYFTSGNTRKTTYVFNESCGASDGKVSLRGLNEKLGSDKQFVITGRIDNKTLITESFKCNK